MSFSLAIDVGATFIKVARTDEAGDVTGPVVRIPCPQGEPRAGVTSSLIDPYVLMDAVFAAIAEAAEDRVPECIAVANQMHGFVMVNDDRQPSHGVVTWQDGRGADAVATIRETLGRDTLRRVGNELRTGIPIATLVAMRGDGDILPAGTILSIGDWVVASLTDAIPVMHATNAAAMGFFDLEASCWDAPCLEVAGLSVARLPSVVADVRVAGRSAAGSDVLVAVGDQQAALLGMGLAPDEISFNVATGAQVARIVDEGLAPEVQTRPFFDRKVLHTVTHVPAGRALNAWIRLFAELAAPDLTLDQAWEQVFAKMSGSVPSTRPTFGLGVFDSADGDRGFVQGVTEQNLTVSAFAGGAIASCAKSLALHAERVGYEGAARAVFSGGWLKPGRFMDKALAAEIPVPVRVAEDGEDVLSGLALLMASR
jgi:sugar (pentulose or hexulose) kinase